jgi:glycosyltransferase involved in cell wall biosynthesis
MHVKSKLSVIIPTFNHGQYLMRAIDSVLGQTYKNLEIIVVDDGSTDNTKDQARAYDGLITYIYQPNKGLADARNTGIKASLGEFIAFLDADDWFLKDNLQIKMSFLESHRDAAWVYSDWQYVDEEGNYLKRGAEKFKYAAKKLNGYIFQELVHNRNFISPCTVVVKKTVLEDVNYFDPNVICQEDLDLWLRISLKYPAHYMDKVLVYVTVHPKSLSTDFTKWVNGNAVIADKLKDLIPDNFQGRQKLMNKIIADKHTFWGRDFSRKGQFSKAIQEYCNSINHLPLQKRVYWLMLLAIIGLIKGYLHPATTSEKGKSRL